MDYLQGAKDIQLSKEEVEHILTEINKAKDVINKMDITNSSWIIVHLNNIGSLLVN